MEVGQGRNLGCSAEEKISKQTGYHRNVIFNLDCCEWGAEVGIFWDIIQEFAI
jgi:hypothetical protein